MASESKLLLVEDDEMIYVPLRLLLEYRGWQVTVATQVREALAHLTENAPHTVILDLMLPDGEGLAILEHVRQEGLDCRVIITTGINDYHRLRTADALQPDAILTKPVELDDLLATLRA